MITILFALISLSHLIVLLEVFTSVLLKEALMCTVNDHQVVLETPQLCATSDPSHLARTLYSSVQ
jgi:hypothetical protein